MVYSKEWNWKEEKNTIWLKQPSEESYLLFYCKSLERKWL